jgi:hypothetical protein
MVWRLKNRKQVILSVKYAYGFVLMAKEETVLQEMPVRLTKIGICNGMEMSVDKNYIMRISSKSSQIQIMTNQK